ncbi:MAG: hypothetical protein ACT4N8_11415 [Sphingosinicella sp.]|uniref:hypothetical protein n=1 Tax=Sphingosinicella sp. TaxID=1917971 RepID=UPI004037D50C
MLLRKRIELYLKRAEMPATRFGREALGDPRFVHDIRRGREPRPETRARVHAWLDRKEGGTPWD